MTTTYNHVARTNKGLNHFNSLVPRARKLESRFALDQLRGLAKHLCQTDFLSWIAFIFGFDLSAETVEKLRQALLDDSVPNPPIEIVSASQLNGREGRYNDISKTVFIAEEALDEALDATGDELIEANWKLMIILVEEFGHHIDTLLRTVYDSIGGDAKGDEGAEYAYAVVHLDYDRTKKKEYAQHTEIGHEKKLFVDYEGFNEAVQKYLSEEERTTEDKIGDEEYFGSGRNRDIAGISFGHESIEDTLAKAGFTKDEQKRTYVGNWESDYSQVIVPLLVRGSNEHLFFKRNTLTQVVNVLCELHFGAHYHQVTEKSLGVYLPEHHIDNPKGIEDGKTDDPEFRGKWTKAEIGIDHVRGMKNYIATPVSGWGTATGEIEKQLKLAVFSGRTKEGLRSLGRGLHVVEDYFAHSNFVEVTLIKLGYKVYPWVPIPASGKITITTGTFGGLDTAASILGAVGEKLTKDEVFQPGEISTSQKLVLILLRDRFPNIAFYYGLFLRNKSLFERQNSRILKFLIGIINETTKWLRWLIGMAMRKIAEAIHETQNLIGNDPNSTDPTHTQIAKDHDDHHFHVIAATLASEAVRQIGEAIIERWSYASPSSDEIGIVLFPKACYKLNDLSGAERSKLEQYVSSISARAKNEDTVILLGHASAEGNVVYNQFLSEQRAITVENYFRNKIKNVRLNFSHIGVGASGAAANAPEWRRTNIGLSTTGAPLDPVELAKGFIVNPVDTNWMDDIVSEWAKSHPAEIKRGKSRTFHEHYLNEIEEKTAPWLERGNQELNKMMKWLEDADDLFKNFISPKK